MSYDRWKTRSPDDDVASPDPSTWEQEAADYLDEQQRGLMTKEQVDAIPRVEARQLIAQIPAGPRYDDRVLLAVEQAMNLEWWRGYHAANPEAKVKALEAFATHATYPVAKEINPRGYEWRGQEALDHAKELADAALSDMTKDRT